jgi:class 3 adenylate cyclase
VEGVISDGHLYSDSSARRALHCAVAMQQAFAARNAAHPSEAIHVRIGLHTGEAIREADDFFGKTVILAARIAAEARGGEILVSALVKELAQSPGDIRFDDGREVALKGLSGAFTLYSVHWIQRVSEPAHRP